MRTLHMLYGNYNTGPVNNLLCHNSLCNYVYTSETGHYIYENQCVKSCKSLTLHNPDMSICGFPQEINGLIRGECA